MSDSSMNTLLSKSGFENVYGMQTHTSLHLVVNYLCQKIICLCEWSLCYHI